MFHFEMLDVAIGLSFVYLILSLVVTAFNEAVAGWLKSRALTLRRGVAHLLDDAKLTEQFYDHPLIRGLQQGPKGPSYIPSRTFALALLDIVAPIKDGRRSVPAPEGTKRSVDHVLRVLSEDVAGDAEQLKEQVEIWFNNAMERVSGRYKRLTQMLLLIWASVITVGTNADSLVIANALWRDPALRQSVVARAEKYVSDQQPSASSELANAQSSGSPGPPPVPPDQQADADFDDASARLRAAVADLHELDLPIGWQARKVSSPTPPDEGSLRITTDDTISDWPGAIWPFDGNDEWARWFNAVDEHGLGWLLTIFAISLGAPFWFDTLNRIVAVRSVGKAPEEKPKAPKTVPKPREPGQET